MYKLKKGFLSGIIDSVQSLTDNTFIPFDPANTDYQQFKVQVADGTPLEDPDGSIMTQTQVDEFLKTIP